MENAQPLTLSNESVLKNKLSSSSQNYLQGKSPWYRSFADWFILSVFPYASEYYQKAYLRQEKLKIAEDVVATLTNRNDDSALALSQWINETIVTRITGVFYRCLSWHKSYKATLNKGEAFLSQDDFNKLPVVESSTFLDSILKPMVAYVDSNSQPCHYFYEKVKALHQKGQDGRSTTLPELPTSSA